MSWWRLSTDTLVNCRFVLSPLAETLACLKTLERGSAAHPGERAWLGTHLPAYRARQAAHPLSAAVIKAALGATWNADFLTPTPPPDAPSPVPAGRPARRAGVEALFAREVAQVRRTPPGRARDDLAVSCGRRTLPPGLRRDDLAARAADTLEWIWRETALPDWPRRQRVIEADVVSRTAQLSHGGWASALEAMRPGMRWLGGSRLQISADDHPHHELDGAHLMFVPVTPRAGWVSWTEPRPDGAAVPRRYAVVYPCDGALAEAGRRRAPAALDALLGPGRAAVLVLLDTPKSTSQLVALTGQGLGSVGRHLRVLREAHLLGRRRVGRSVFYYRTGAGEALVSAQGMDGGTVPAVARGR